MKQGKGILIREEFGYHEVGISRGVLCRKRQAAYLELSIQLDKPVADGVLDKFGTTAKFQFGHDMGSMGLDCGHAEHQKVGNFLVGMTLGNEF